MENRAHLLAAGLFVFGLLVAMAGAVWWFIGRQEPTHTYLLETSSSVTGLNREAQVRFRGIRAGKVLDLYTDPDDPSRVLVEIAVSRRFVLTDRTVARLMPQGLTGLSYVLLEEGKSGRGLPLPTDGTARLPLQAGLIETLSRQASELGERLLALADRAGRLLSEENLARVASLLARLDEGARQLAEGGLLLRELRDVVAENRVRLAHALERIEHASGAAPELVAEARQALVRLDRLGERMEALGERYQRLGERFEEDTLVEFEALLREGRYLSQRLARLAEEIEHDPSLLVAGRKAPPGPGEPGFLAPVENH